MNKDDLLRSVGLTPLPQNALSQGLAAARGADLADVKSLTEEVSSLRRELDYYRQRAIELDNQVFQMRTLLQSGKGFSELLSVTSLLNAILAVCRERYDIDCATVLLKDDLDSNTSSYRVRAYHGLPDTYYDPVGRLEEELLLFRFPQDQGLLWQVVSQGDVFSVRDMAGEPRFKIAFRRWNLEVLQSDVWVPLISTGGVLGLITLGARGDGTSIPEQEYDFLQEIAAVAATNIDSCVKYEKNERILQNLRTLYDVNQQLANVHDFKQLTIETLATAVEALRAQKANLMLYNADTEKLEIKVVWGNIPRATRDAINEGKMETRAFALGEGVSGEAALYRRPVRINDRSQIEQVGRNTVHCIMAVPLLYGEAVLGVITLTNKVRSVDDVTILDPLGRYGAEDEQLLLGLADQAAANLHKARLYSASITDRLTGLHNARQFEVQFDGVFNDCKTNGASLALVVFDIDNFKKFNDTYGHRVGDLVLAEVGRLTSKALRSGTRDTAYRYGGEEFCLVLPGTTQEDAVALVTQLSERVQAHEIEHEGHQLRVTFSAGVAVFPEAAESRAELFEAADGAMYKAKQTGRNRIMVAG